MGGGRRPLPDDDRALWRSVTADITPLAGRDAKPTRQDVSPKQQPSNRPLPLPAEQPVARPTQVALEPGQITGVDRRTAERLRRGQLPIDRRLDLHGMTRAEAHLALNTAIAAAWESGCRVLLIITGKGQGILRDSVPRWLNEGTARRRILAFMTAQPKHGGSGALYVLLKRRR